MQQSVWVSHETLVLSSGENQINVQTFSTNMQSPRSRITI